MAKSFSCKCNERSKPISERNWLVIEYKWNSGAFVRAGGEPSDYSSVICKACGHSGRTKAKFVDSLPVMKSGKDLENITYKSNCETNRGERNVRHRFTILINTCIWYSCTSPKCFGDVQGKVKLYL